MMNDTALFDAAIQAAEHSYSPYSHFRVGAALLCKDGTIITGANIENRSFGLTICAERNAVGTALASGRKDFVALAVAAPDSGYPVSPCGACRQGLSEFLSPDCPIQFGSAPDNRVFTTMGELFPHDALHDLSRKEH